MRTFKEKVPVLKTIQEARKLAIEHALTLI
jgi:hypothetical protein